jgi:hypothetical protein
VVALGKQGLLPLVVVAAVNAMLVCVPVRAVEAPLSNPRPDAAAAAQGWPRREVLELALRAYRCGAALGYIGRPLLTVIDYSLPSRMRRLWVIDVERNEVLFHELVAHGRNTGADRAVAFSNRLGSNQSSLGLFRTEDTYRGGHGLTLRLTGLEPGVNDRADERRIVMHGADYVSETFAARHGRLGRSWGCPALSREISHRVIEQIRDGSALFAYYPDPDWLDSSRFLNCDTADATLSR